MPSCSPPRKKKRKKKRSVLPAKHELSSDEEFDTKKLKRSVSVQEEKMNFPPILNRSVSTFGAVASFKIPKLAKPKPSSET